MHHVSGYVRRRGVFARPAGWNAWSLQHALTRTLLSARPSGMLSDTEPLWHQLHTMRQVWLHAPCVCAGAEVRSKTSPCEETLHDDTGDICAALEPELQSPGQIVTVMSSILGVRHVSPTILGCGSRAKKARRINIAY